MSLGHCCGEYLSSLRPKTKTVTHAKVGFGEATAFESFLFLYVTPIKLTALQSWTFVVSLLWTDVALCLG